MANGSMQGMPWSPGAALVRRWIWTGWCARAPSFGSFWTWQIAAAQPILKGCAALAIFEPGASTIFGEASPTFKAWHMFMAGLYEDEAAFDEMVRDYDLQPLVSTMHVSWLVVAGEADELSPARWVYELARAFPAPSTLVIYQGGRHALTESQGAMLGPPWRSRRLAAGPRTRRTSQ